MSQFFTYPAIAVTASNPSIGSNGSAAPTSSTEIGFIDATGKLQGVSPTNPLPVDIHIDTVVVSEDLTRVGGNPVNIGIGAAGTGTQRVAVSSDSTLTSIGSITNALPAGSNTIGSINAINTAVTVTQSIGSALHVNVDSLPAIPAGANNIGGVELIDSAGTNKASISASGALKVDGSASTQPVSGTVTVQQATASSLNATVVGVGVAGTPSGGVVSVQGVSGGQAVPVSGTVSISGTLSENLAQVAGSTVATAASGVQKVGVVGNSGSNLDSAAGVSNTQAITIQGNASGIAVPISGTVTSTISGNVTVVQPAGSNLHVAVDSLPSLPAGANTIGAISNTSFGISGSLPAGSNAIGSVSVSNTVADNLTQVGGSSISLGQKTMANGLPVTIASDQSALAANASFVDGTASGSITNTQNVAISTAGMGTVGLQVTGTWTGVLAVEATVDGSNWFSTNFVAFTSGGTGTTLASNNAGQISVSGATQIRIRGNTVTSGTAVVSLRANQTASVVMLDSALPSGSNTIGTVNINGTVPVTQGGKFKVNLARNDYSTTNVTTSAYVQLIASTSAASNMLEIFDSSGQTLVLAVGAPGSEVDQMYINPGGNGQVPLLIPISSRVSIKAVTATASAGYINLTLYS